MPFRLPKPASRAREAMGDPAHVAEVLDPRNLHRMEFFCDALRRVRSNGLPDGVKAINMIVLRSDDERWLISIGPRGGWRRLWNFGTGRD